MPLPTLIAPSLLSANLLNLQHTVETCRDARAHILHVDVMDGQFVPPITFGHNLVQTIKPLSDLIIDCHLMVRTPEAHIEQFARSGATWISVHAEACTHMHRTLTAIQTLGCKAGIVLNPATPIEYAMEVADIVDFILLMSVNPGYGGQRFIPSFLSRCRRLRSWLDANNYGHVAIEVDGGVTLENVEQVVAAGANIVVSGSGLFTGDLRANITAMRTRLHL
jgi:ribulose-phosphate 3-epimerase